MRISDQQPPQPVHRQPARPVHIELGRPPTRQVMAIPVEHLNPVRQVRQKQMVLGIERRRPRLLQVSRFDAMNPPNKVRRHPRPQTAAPSRAE
jgi:hypothetical protein